MAKFTAKKGWIDAKDFAQQWGRVLSDHWTRVHHTMLMELTDTPCLVSMSDDDGTRVVLTQGTTNHLVWPLSSAFTPDTADAPEDPDK